MLAKRNWIYTSISLIFIGLGFAFLGQKQTIGKVELNTASNCLFGIMLVGYGVFLQHFLSLKPKYRPIPLAYFTTFVCWISIHAFYSSGYLPEQIIEHGIFIGLPIYLLFLLITKKQENPTAIKLLIALTFTGHGIYALGVHYVPNNFIDMTTTILGLNHPDAYLFLKIVGAIDLMVAGMLFFAPSKWVIYYIIFWGIITAFARFIYGFYVSNNPVENLYWFGSMVYRLPHGVLAFYLLFPAIIPKK